MLKCLSNNKAEILVESEFPFTLAVLLSGIKHFLYSTTLQTPTFYRIQPIFFFFTFIGKPISPALCTLMKAFICFIINL